MANGLLGGIAGQYRAEWLIVMRGKLGLDGVQDGDGALVDDLLAAMAGSGVGADWTLVFHRLGDEALLRPLFEDFSAMAAWLPRWRARIAPDWLARMARVNPAVIPRNHQVEAALDAATAGDMGPFQALLAAVVRPFPVQEGYVLPAPTGFGGYVTYCGT